MMEDELIRIWQSSPQEERIKFDKSRLILDVQSSLDRFDRLIKYGILSEQIAAVIIIPVFSFYVYWVPFLLSKLASVYLVAWTCWYMFRLRRFKKAKPEKMSENYLGYLHKYQKYMLMMKKMGDTAIYWYICPCILGVLLFMLGPILDGVLTGEKMIAMLSIAIGAGVLSYYYLRWMTRMKYEKRLKKIDKLIKVLKQ